MYNALTDLPSNAQHCELKTQSFQFYQLAACNDVNIIEGFQTSKTT